ncbi:MAG TPA: transglycosylase SLT domain-containing protein [Burkholderiaceae bacterium]|nr:transglycosylase SLT domain-containing protein [Burkholderiaceae bacterium]
MTASPAAAVPAADAAAPAAAAPTADTPAQQTASSPPAAPAADAVPPQQAAEAAIAPKGDLWERIRKGFGMPDLTSKKAANSTHWYAGQPDYVGRMSGRASLYLYYIVQEIEKRGLPTELALLPFVESAMQPQAVSSAQAAGLWQFIPSTGKLYSLEQNLWKDERLGVVESTRAALDYLEKLHAEFGSWYLALAAYNYGEAGVERALAYNRSRHKPLNYESLRLPRETQNYVPKLQAIKNIVSDPQRYGIELPAIRDEPYFVTISGSRDIDVTTAAQLAEMPIEDFQALNPAFNRPLIVGAMAPTILLPADRGERFSANMAAWQATGQPLASWSAYRLKSGETLAAVALRVGVTEAALRTANHVPPRYVAASGSTILIPRDETMGEDVSSEMLDGSVALVPEKAGLRKITVRVRRGDSLASIARRWHVTQDEIIAWNDLRSPSVFAGQRLSLTVASSSSSGAHKKPARGTHHSENQTTTLARAAPTAR